jgi:hypothetical protein
LEFVMPQLPLMAVVLADADGVMTLIFVVFAIISGIMKLVNGAQGEAPAPAAGNKPKPARPKSLEDEIASFLNDVKSKNREGAGGNSGRDPKQPAEVIFDERPRPTAQRPGQATKPKPPQATPPKPQRGTQESRKKGSAASPPMANRSPKKPVATQSAAGAQQRVAGHAAELGQGVQSHLKAHMSERIGQMVSHDLAPRISESVASHLGNATPVTTAATVAQVPEHPLLSELRQPQTLQRAMVASLILAPPRALANRR